MVTIVVRDDPTKLPRVVRVHGAMKLRGARLRAFAADYNDGMTTAELAAKYGVCADTARSYIRRLAEAA